MKRVPIAEAEARWSALLGSVEAGDEVVITRDGKAVARLVPVPQAKRSVADVFRTARLLGGFDMAGTDNLPNE
ncbi:MAG: type II toxin-antitoxin system prevent-host-death family antitoxin [Planctomycetes bacterium]|nr:type II toxin-antitoxin system prevent-host-death family antitoxin [Planctomycetota bacterium]